ncbi:MAG: hypothetical protein OCU22_07770 [Canidatus Methanoxibalbensis ujae]|nr:hypothetical protein [Candidatus Methanoxibalbensis ujae]
MFEDIFEAIFEALQGAFDTLGSWIDEAFSAILDGLTALGDFLVSAFEWIYKGLSSLGEYLGNAISAIASALETFGSWVYSAFEWMYKGLSAVGEWLWNGLCEIGKAIAGFGEWLWNAFLGFGEWLWGGLQWIGSALSVIGEAIYSFGEWIYTSIVNGLNWLIGALSSIFTWLASVFEGMWNALCSIAEDFISQFNVQITQLFEDLRHKFKNMFIAAVTIPATASLLKRLPDVMSNGFDITKLLGIMGGCIALPIVSYAVAEIIDRIIETPKTKALSFLMPLGLPQMSVGEAPSFTQIRNIPRRLESFPATTSEFRLFKPKQDIVSGVRDEGMLKIESGIKVLILNELTDNSMLSVMLPARIEGESDIRGLSVIHSITSPQYETEQSIGVSVELETVENAYIHDEESINDEAVFEIA